MSQESTSSAGAPPILDNSLKTIFIDEKGREILIEDRIYYDDVGNAIVYSYDDQSQLIYREEVVEGEYVDSAPSTSTSVENSSKSLRFPKEACPASTLLTAKCLEASTATFLSKSGRKSAKKSEISTKINKNGSELNRNIPGMKTLFDVIKESAIKKAEETMKKETLVPTESEEIVEKVHETPEDLDDVNDEPPPPMEKIGMESSEFPDPIFEEWPLYSRKAVDFKEACELLIGMQEIEETKICKTIPLQFKHEGTFLIDIRNLRDLNCDDNGGWETPSGKTRFYKETEAGDLVRADDGKGRLKNWTKDFTFKIVLKKYENRVTRSADDDRGHFQKKIYLGQKMDHRLPFAIITYSWTAGRPWNFVQAPSNSKIIKKPNWEKKSFDKVNVESMPQMVSSFYEGFGIYSPFVLSFDEATSIMLGATHVEPNKLCSSVPIGYRQNGSFVIDLKRMGYCFLELRRDDNGLWSKPSGSSRFYKFAENGDAIRVDKGGKMLPPGNSDYDVKIMSKRYEHPQVDKKFVRKIYTAHGKTTDSFPGSPGFAVIVYYWKGEPIPFEPICKQNNVLVHQNKEFSRFQQIADEEQEYVETIGAEQQIVMEKEILDQSPPQLKRARFGTGESSENVQEMKIQLIRREMENQDRFSAVLDRAESFLDRIERNFGAPVFEGQWAESGEQIIEEEVMEEEY